MGGVFTVGKLEDAVKHASRLRPGRIVRVIAAPEGLMIADCYDLREQAAIRSAGVGGP